MAITKNDDEVKIQSGNDFRVLHNGAWITLGNIMEGTLVKKADNKEIKYNNGYKFNKRASAMSTLSVVLAQVSKEIIDKIDQLLSNGKPLYFYNGIDNTEHMEFYIPKANLIENMSLSMKGDEQQVIALEFSVVAQSGNASVIPSSGLPADAKSHGVSTLQTGYNPFWIVLATAG